MDSYAVLENVQT